MRANIPIYLRLPVFKFSMRAMNASQLFFVEAAQLSEGSANTLLQDKPSSLLSSEHNVFSF